MKKFTIAGFAASALAAGFLGLAAPASAAPSGASTAEDTISSLQDQGYTVIVNNADNAPLDQAQVVNIRQGSQFTESYHNAQDQWHGRVTSSIVFVDVK